MDSRHHLPSFYLAFLSGFLFLLLSALTSTASAREYLMDKLQSVSLPKVDPDLMVIHDGFYIGLAGGYDYYRVRQSTNLTFNGHTISQTPVITPSGFVGGILGGCGVTLPNHLYLGGETFVNISGASTKSSSSDAVSTFETKTSVGTSFGFSLLPGFKLYKDLLLYLRLGLSVFNFNTQENFTVSGQSTSSHESAWRRGISSGFGLEKGIYENLSLRGEYTYTSYNKFDATLDTTYSPSDNQVMLSLIYHVY